MGYSVKRRESEQAWAVLMRAAVNGDAGAYRQFLASLAPVLRATARRNCARVGLDGGEAEDVVQETLLAIHLKRHTWDLDRPIGPWITAIARHKLIDAIERSATEGKSVRLQACRPAGQLNSPPFDKLRTSGLRFRSS